MSKLALPIRVERLEDKKTGYRVLSLVDANGLAIANMIGQANNSEHDQAEAICRLVNGTAAK